MSLLTKIASLGISDIVTSIGDAIDKNVTSEAERITLKNELKRIELDYVDKKEEREKQLDLAADSEATTRLQADMSSDNKWSKNIRPASYAFSLAMLTLFTLTDGNVWGTTIKSEYIQVWAFICYIQVGFYFSSRGIEKVANIVSRVFKK
jgi:hypothetical protein